MLSKCFAGVLAVIAAAVGPALADDDAVRRELAPTGTMRVAIAVSPSPSALYVVEDKTTGGWRGVTIDLGKALAEKLGVKLAFVPYLATGEIQASAASNAWDVSFMPVDAERKKFVDFGSPYHLLQSTYLVAPGSKIASIADANRPQVRIARVAGTATGRASTAASPNATNVQVKGVDEAVEMMRAAKVDAIALSRESLVGLLPKLPGARVLDGGFLNSTTAIAVPKGKPAALAYVSAFIEDAKRSGLIRRSLDAIGLKTSEVAPIGMAP